MASTPACLICGTTADPTVEHIIPQALWRRFDLDPDSPRLDRYRTQLCSSHNRATAALHNRPRLLDLIETGEPVDNQTLRHLGDWAVWVTLLLGLRAGTGVLRSDDARDALRRRFDGHITGPPRGIRVYAARAADHVTGTRFTSHQVGVEQDDRIVVDHSGVPVGFSARLGAITASDSICIGKIAMLVLSRTYNSGPNHNGRLDRAAATVGLDRIHPFPSALPVLAPTPIDMRAVSRVFSPPGHGDDVSLLPPAVRTMAAMITP